MAVKLGMMPVWTKTGDRHVVTMLQVAHSSPLLSCRTGDTHSFLFYLEMVNTLTVHFIRNSINVHVFLIKWSFLTERARVLALVSRAALFCSHSDEIRAEKR